MNIELFYIEKGKGESLILLHGNGENGDYFCHQIEELSKRYRVIAPDTRGHGRTPRGQKPFTIRQFAADLLDFMDRLEIPKSHILGFSDGANIAMIFAMEHPERVNKLILNGGNLNTAGVKRRTQWPIEIGYRIARLFAGKSAEAKAHAEMLGLMVNDPNIEPAKLQRITAPTLVVAGTRDMIKESHTRLIAASITNAELAFVDGTHFVANRNPNAFNNVIMRFLEK